MSLMNLLVESGISFKDWLECSDNFCFNGPSMRSEAQGGLVNEWPADQLNCQWRWRANSVMPQNLHWSVSTTPGGWGCHGCRRYHSGQLEWIPSHQRLARAWKRGDHILQTSNLQNLGDVPIFLPPYAAKHGQVWNEVPEAVNPGYEGLHPHRLEEYHQSNMSDKSVQGGKPRPLQAWFALASRGYCCGGQGTVKQIRGNVPEKLGHEFRKAKNSGTQRWYSPLRPCRKCFCMEGQVEMLQSTVRIAEKNATVIQQHIRGHLWRKRLNMMIAAARLIQQHFRAHWACSMPASWQPLGLVRVLLFTKFLARVALPLCRKPQQMAGWWPWNLQGPSSKTKAPTRIYITSCACWSYLSTQRWWLRTVWFQQTHKDWSWSYWAGPCFSSPNAGRYPPETLPTYAMRLLRLCISCSGSPSSMATWSHQMFAWAMKTDWPCVLKLCDFEVAQELPADGFCAQKVGMVLLLVARNAGITRAVWLQAWYLEPWRFLARLVLQLRQRMGIFN